MSAQRYTRQVRLAEVGEAGQARVAALAMSVRAAGAAGAIEARYLAGAGVRELRVREASHAEAARAVDATVRVVDEASQIGDAPAMALPVAVLPALEALALDPSARDVAAGAWLALDALRGALGIAPTS